MSFPPEHLHQQHDLFSGKQVDTRTAKQKRADQQREAPQQPLMFSQREIAQFGVNSHPLLPLSPNTKLVLVREDPRTPEQMAYDLQKAAEAQTYHLFDVYPAETTSNATAAQPITITEENTKQSAYWQLVTKVQAHTLEGISHAEHSNHLVQIVTAALCAQANGLALEEILAAVQVACYTEKPVETPLQFNELLRRKQRTILMDFAASGGELDPLLIKPTDDLLHFAVGALGAVITPFEIANPPDFEIWMESPLGKEVQQHIRRRANYTEQARFDAPEDVMQRSLIWLWEKYDHDSKWFDEHHAGYIAKAAVRSSKCKYTYRNYLLQTPTECSDSFDELDTGTPAVTTPDTSIHPHDKGLTRVDLRLDVQRAVEASIQALVAHYRTYKNRNSQSSSPERVEEMLHIVWEGFRDHYEGKNGGAGKGRFAAFCKSKGISESQGYRWRNKLLAELPRHLDGYSLAAT